jgi:hypothetical protein
VVVFQDPALSKNREIYRMADGFHRYDMHRKLGLRSIKADIRQGDRRDAILYSIGANAKQGKQLTTADRAKAVINPARKMVREHEDLAVSGGVTIVTGRGATPVFGVGWDSRE